MQYFTNTTLASQHQADLLASADSRRLRRVARWARRNESRR
jgi:hypothetical protein